MYEKIDFIVSGQVQGVCFRAYTQRAAQDLEVTGWVRNRSDGRVEGEAWGLPEAIEGFVQWLHKGSPHGRVDRVEVDRKDLEEKRPTSFSIRF
jgi:acylphosphatase